MSYKYNPLLVGKLDRVGAGASSLGELDDVNTAGTVNGKVLTYQSGTWQPEAAAGGGDMLKAEYVTGSGTVYNASRLDGETLATVQAHNVAASKITTGTFGLARIPAIDDARIPDLETLSYGAAFADGQIPNLAAAKITSGSFNANRIPVLPASRITTGTFNLNRIPAVDDAHIPNVDGLGYGGAFAEGQIPNLGASKITSGSFNANRIPILPTNRYGSAVLLTGAQSIGGTKTFTDIPILPASNPTADNEAARKAYVDSATAGDIDGGLYSDTYINTADINGGTF
jgi:hypothetical protein